MVAKLWTTRLKWDRPGFQKVHRKVNIPVNHVNPVEKKIQYIPIFGYPSKVEQTWISESSPKGEYTCKS